MPFTANSVTYVISGAVFIDFFSPHLHHYFFLLPCVPCNFLLNVRHCEFYIVLLDLVLYL